MGNNKYCHAIQSVIQVTIIAIIATIPGVRFACGPAGILLIAAIIFLFSSGFPVGPLPRQRLFPRK
jgi:hypothetical protein